MEGIIPFILRATKKKRTQNPYLCLAADNPIGRSRHLLLAGDSIDGSSHRLSRSDYPHPAAFECFSAGGRAATPSDNENGLRQRGFTSAAQCHVSART
ncbi:hypothetical protein PHJA_001007300 [Phtheirospermum japonicum]|uniref:Uncharacterized protein n=1 Tax=Phtheirospermum japonicum TaxID=374723 RepID=A0A830BP74_9LAMI|nr:hypothetical protein PHJA_001007300 [Phtheirospermum japonicum]